MLVLSRKKNESVVINDCITVVIVDIRGDKVRLGIEAPKDVSVFRKEIYESIREQSAIESLSKSEPTENSTENIAVPHSSHLSDSLVSHSEIIIPAAIGQVKDEIREQHILEIIPCNSDFPDNAPKSTSEQTKKKKKKKISDKTTVQTPNVPKKGSIKTSAKRFSRKKIEHLSSQTGLSLLVSETSTTDISVDPDPIDNLEQF